MKGLILAAGLGTRLRPLTNTIPKPAIPFLNVPLGYWAMFHLIHAGVDELVVNTHHLPEKIVTLFEAVQDKVKALHFSHETEKILGSGGGIGHARKFLTPSQGLLSKIFKSREKLIQEHSFWVANGDEVLLPENIDLFKNTWRGHLASGNLATLIVIENPDVGTKFGGVWCDDAMNVRGFGKTPPSSGLKGYHFTGFQVLNARVLSLIPPGESNIFYDILVGAITKGERVSAVLTKGIWIETGNMDDLKLGTEQLHALKDQNPTLKSIIKEFSLK